MLRHADCQPGGNVLGGIVAAALDADDLLGNLLIHAAPGGHDGLALRCEEKPELGCYGCWMGAYCGLAALVNPCSVAGIVGGAGMGGVADAEDVRYLPLLGLLVL